MSGQVKRYGVYVCPDCGEELDPYDVDPKSITDVGASRNEIGNFICGECLNELDKEVEYERVEVAPESELLVALAYRREFLSAFKVWRDATVKRCKLLSSRESSDSMLFPDQAFIERVEEIAATSEKGER